VRFDANEPYTMISANFIIAPFPAILNVIGSCIAENLNVTEQPVVLEARNNP
jgi:hypothetical protein